MSTIQERHSRPRPLPDVRRRAANPLWRRRSQQLEVIVSWCKQAQAYLWLWVTFLVFVSLASWLGDNEEGQEGEVMLGSPGMDPRDWELEAWQSEDSNRGNIFAVFCWVEIKRILNTLWNSLSAKNLSSIFFFFNALSTVLVLVCFSAT